MSAAAQRSLEATMEARAAAAEAGRAPNAAVAWAAIIAGAVVAAALALALATLGAGIGLVSISPWSTGAAAVTTFGVLAAAWFVATQLFAMGVGGYLAGRLRAGAVGVDHDEAFFRDTAHGLLVWALAAVVGAGLAAAAAGGAASAVGQAAGAPASRSAAAATSYFVDLLFRSDRPPTADDGAARAEVGRILATDAAAGGLSNADRAYVAQLVAARAGLSPADAEKRVSDVVDRAKAAADAARKTGVAVALWAFVSLLVGAFSASYMATVGGRIRDEVAAA